VDYAADERNPLRARCRLPFGVWSGRTAVGVPVLDLLLGFSLAVGAPVLDAPEIGIA
jgi:hypothetical protein